MSIRWSPCIRWISRVTVSPCFLLLFSFFFSPPRLVSLCLPQVERLAIVPLAGNQHHDIFSFVLFPHPWPSQPDSVWIFSRRRSPTLCRVRIARSVTIPVSIFCRFLLHPILSLTPATFFRLFFYPIIFFFTVNKIPLG